MDKYDLVLDIVEHPENYSSEELSEILSDPEIREIYNVLCDTDSAIEADKEIDIEAEWKKYSTERNLRYRSPFSFLGSRAASIAAIICTSLAVAAGIAVSISIIGTTSSKSSDIENAISNEESIATTTFDTISNSKSSAFSGHDQSPILFEDTALETIMNSLAAIYHVDVKFKNNEVGKLHLYYVLDPSLPIDEIVSQLNTFEQINIELNGNTLIIK